MLINIYEILLYCLEVMECLVEWHEDMASECLSHVTDCIGVGLPGLLELLRDLGPVTVQLRLDLVEDHCIFNTDVAALSEDGAHGVAGVAEQEEVSVGPGVALQGGELSGSLGHEDVFHIGNDVLEFLICGYDEILPCFEIFTEMFERVGTHSLEEEGNHEVSLDVGGSDDEEVSGSDPMVLLVVLNLVLFDLLLGDNCLDVPVFIEVQRIVIPDFVMECLLDGRVNSVGCEDL